MHSNKMCLNKTLSSDRPVLASLENNKFKENLYEEKGATIFFFMCTYVLNETFLLTLFLHRFPHDKYINKAFYEPTPIPNVFPI